MILGTEVSIELDAFFQIPVTCSWVFNLLYKISFPNLRNSKKSTKRDTARFTVNIVNAF